MLLKAKIFQSKKRKDGSLELVGFEIQIDESDSVKDEHIRNWLALNIYQQNSFTNIRTGKNLLQWSQPMQILLQIGNGYRYLTFRRTKDESKQSYLIYGKNYIVINNETNSEEILRAKSVNLERILNAVSFETAKRHSPNSPLINVDIRN